MLPPARHQSGFTLMEMVVILTIIALIIGGVLMGRSIMRNSELQAVISDVNRLRNAAKMFQDKYTYLPGDFPDAGSLWGGDTGCNVAATPDTDAATENHVPKKATCGGNGDGSIGNYGSVGGPPSPAYIGSWTGSTPSRETLRLWQHLANAGFIEGQYSGIGSDGLAGYGIVAGMYPGLNVPASKMGDKNGYIMFQANYVTSAGKRMDGTTDELYSYPGQYGHVIEFGTTNGVSAKAAMLKPGMTAEDAAQIDSKIDDGKPGYGSVLPFNPTNSAAPDCTNSGDPALAYYKTTVEGINCSLIFVTGF